MLLNVFVKGNFCDFLNLSIFYIFSINILLILSKYRSTFPLYEIKTNFVADCFNRRFSGFGTTSFHTKFSDSFA